ncbi:MAG: hypothetical protein EBU70_01525 [Actinobacteria bacterium]|nr:hypothetical protein [Actinomycetota bacterium]
MGARALRAASLAAMVLVATSCQATAAVDLQIEPNGQGTLSLVVTADQDMVAAAPGLAESLSLSDAQAAGWQVSPVAPDPQGRLQVRLWHDFDTPEEANLLLGQLSGTDGPFRGLRVARERDGGRSTWTLDGTLELVNGLSSLADAGLIQLAQAAPFQQDLAASGLTLDQVFLVTFRVTMPGTIDSTTGVQDVSTVQWTAPLDGSAVEVTTTSTHESRLGAVAGPLAPALLWLAGGWLVAMLLFAAASISRRTPRS